MKKITFALAIFLLLTVAFTPRIFAEELEASSSPRPTKFRQEFKEIRKNIADLRPTSRSGVKVAKGKLCEVHARNINKRADMMTQRVEKMMVRFDRISTSIQKFYVEKLVPQGKTLSNYDALVANVEAKKAALTLLIDQVQSDADNYNCEVDDPKSEFEDYREDMQALIQGFQDYKKSIRELLVAVMGLKGNPSVSPVSTEE